MSSSPLVVVLLAALACPAAAQGNRDSLTAGNAAYERADFAAAARMLPIGLDPAAGPRDAAWVMGVHKLVDALLQTGDTVAVPLYLAWAHRIEPRFPVDTLLFPPPVTSAIRAARAAAPAAADTFATTTWEFAGGDAAARRGVLRLGRAAGLSFAVLARPAAGGATSLGTVLPDERRTLVAGVYAITFTVTGHPPLTVLREVLPGVTTIVAPRPRAAVVTAEARADSTAALEARLSSGGAASCLVGGPAAFCWGSNAGGLLGGGWTDSTRAPVVVSGGQRLTAITVGGQHACGLAASGAAFCWGAGSQGQLGNGATTASAEPVPVTGGLTFTVVAAGAQHTCAITRSGAVFCWGAGVVGQLGNRATANSSQPVAAHTPAGAAFTALAAGGNHTCGLTTRGAVWCWGAGSAGELGHGAGNNSPTPVAAAGDGGFRAIAAGAQHTCGSDTTGRVHCWGANANGQLGTNNTAGSNRPVPVSDSTAFVSLTAGDAFTCGLTAEGAAWCWGEGASGQLGNGRTADSPRPALVVGGRNFRALAAGASHACGFTSTRMVWCWGRNDAGQLGALAGRTSAVPVPVIARPAPRVVPAGLVPRRDVRDDFEDGNLTAGVVWDRDSTAGARVRVDSGALVVARAGTRGRFGAAGVALPVRIAARDAALRFDVQVANSATPGCGLNCAAWPAVVRVRVKNRDFTETEVWYVFGPAAAMSGATGAAGAAGAPGVAGAAGAAGVAGVAGGSPGTAGATRNWAAGGITVVAHEAAPGQWLRRQRFVIQDVATRADSIIEVAFGGIGTDFEVRFDNILLPSPLVAAVVVAPDSARLTRAAATVQFTAEARDSAGRAQAWVPITWSSSDTAIARVSASGLVTPVASGVVFIRAAAEELADSARVTVRLPAPPRRRGRP